MRKGVWLYPGAPAPELVNAVVAADELGLDEVWIADEGVAREPFSVLSAAAGRTKHIRLGVGITSPRLRHPGALAASALTLDELSSGRAILGLGVGGHQALDPFGLTVDRPVALMRDAITTARAVIAGRRTADYDPPDHAIPARPTPIWIGGRGPQITRLGARLADGIFLSGCSPDELQRIVPDVRSVRSDVELALYHSASDADLRPSTTRWSSIAEDLDAMAGRWEPTSIGINLVDLMAPGTNAVAQVERAAAALGGL
jgi:5,10-methylenetetrahydromethanopterin reductase